MALAVALLTLFGAACGDSGASDLETTTLSVGALPLVDFAPLFYADSQGYFAEGGLDVTVEVVQGGPVAAQLLLAGDIQISYNNWLSVSAAIANGAPLVVVANGTYLGDGQGGVFVTEASSIESLFDLDGKTVATNTVGNVGDITIEALIADAGFDIDVDYVEVAFPEIIPAIESGAVDAGFLTEPFTTFAVQSGLRSIADPYTGRAQNLPIAGYVSTKQFAAENPNSITAFREAIERATRDLAGDEALLRAFIPQYSSVPEAAAAALVLPLYQDTLRTADLQRAADLMFELGFLEVRLDMTEYVING